MLNLKALPRERLFIELLQECDICLLDYLKNRLWFKLFDLNFRMLLSLNLSLGYSLKMSGIRVNFLHNHLSVDFG